jgi:hypothetical protein
MKLSDFGAKPVSGMLLILMLVNFVDCVDRQIMCSPAIGMTHRAH